MRYARMEIRAVGQVGYKVGGVTDGAVSTVRQRGGGEYVQKGQAVRKEAVGPWFFYPKYFCVDI